MRTRKSRDQIHCPGYGLLWPLVKERNGIPQHSLGCKPTVPIQPDIGWNPTVRLLWHSSDIFWEILISRKMLCYCCLHKGCSFAYIANELLVFDSSVYKCLWDIATCAVLFFFVVSRSAFVLGRWEIKKKKRNNKSNLTIFTLLDFVFNISRDGRGWNLSLVLEFSCFTLALISFLQSDSMSSKIWLQNFLIVAEIQLIMLQQKATRIILYILPY